MSTKYFTWDGGLPAGVTGLTYTDGNPVEAQLAHAPSIYILGWHNIADAQRTVIINRLAAAGWIEGGQSKPD